MVDDRVLVEIKSTYVLPVAAKRQTLNYLRATGLQVALLLHFGPDARYYRFVHTLPANPRAGSLPRDEPGDASRRPAPNASSGP